MIANIYEIVKLKSTPYPPQKEKCSTYDEVVSTEFLKIPSTPTFILKLSCRNLSQLPFIVTSPSIGFTLIFTQWSLFLLLACLYTFN